MSESAKPSGKLAHLFFQTEEDGIQVANIKVFATVDREEILDANDLVSDYIHSVGLINATISNAQDFINAIDEWATTLSNRSSINRINLQEGSLDMGRHLLNLLSLYKCLLEHSETTIRRKFGKESKSIKAWKAEQAHQYDTYACYRIFYKLRNFCQHIGLPPIGITMNDQSAEQSPEVFIYLDRDMLLKEDDLLNEKVKSDLNSMPDKIDLNKLTESWLQSFTELYEALLKIRAESAIESCAMIKNLRDEFQIKNNGKIILLEEIESSDPNKLSLKFSDILEQEALFIIQRHT